MVAGAVGRDVAVSLGRGDIMFERMTPEQRRLMTPPDHMSAVAKDLWSDLAIELVRSGATDVDRIGFEMLCEAYAEWCDARAVLDAEGRYYETQSNAGIMKRRHPAVNTLREADATMRQWLIQFGLTPAARLRSGKVIDPDPPAPRPASKYLS